MERGDYKELEIYGKNMRKLRSIKEGMPVIIYFTYE